MVDLNSSNKRPVLRSFDLTHNRHYKEMSSQNSNIRTFIFFLKFQIQELIDIKLNTFFIDSKNKLIRGVLPAFFQVEYQISLEESLPPKGAHNFLLPSFRNYLPMGKIGNMSPVNTIHSILPNSGCSFE